MRPPESLRGAVFSAFDETPPDWVCVAQALLIRMEGHRVTVRDFASRWKMSKSKAHGLLQQAQEAGVTMGLLTAESAPTDEG